jgi:hypothetical protein
VLRAQARRQRERFAIKGNAISRRLGQGFRKLRKLIPYLGGGTVALGAARGGGFLLWVKNRTWTRSSSPKEEETQ